MLLGATFKDLLFTAMRFIHPIYDLIADWTGQLPSCQKDDLFVCVHLRQWKDDKVLQRQIAIKATPY